MLRYRVSLLCICLLWCGLTVAAAAQPSPPSEQGAKAVVERLHATLIDVMQHADSLGYAGRYRQLKPAVKQAFDLPAIARLTVRGYWDDFTPAQRRDFVTAFTRLSVAEYARRFDGYGGETFKTLDASEAAGGRLRVNTELLQPGGETVSLDYVLHADGGHWRIINVISQGVSDLALKRGQYVGALRKQGVDAFLRRIHDKVKALPSSADAKDSE